MSYLCSKTFTRIKNYSKNKVFCENNDCKELFAVSSISGLRDVVYPHLRKVEEGCLHEEQEVLTKDDIDVVISDETCHKT